MDEFFTLRFDETLPMAEAIEELRENLKEIDDYGFPAVTLEVPKNMDNATIAKLCAPYPDCRITVRRT